MLSLHLPQAPCDKFIYVFPCVFWCVVGGYGLRCMCSHCIRASCHYFYGPSGGGWGKSVQRLCGDCTEIVPSQCSCGAVSDASTWKIVWSPCGFHAEAVVTVQLPYHFWACGVRALPVRGLCNANLRHVYGLWTCDFSNLYNFPLNKSVVGDGACESVQKSHSRPLPPHGGRTEGGIRAGYGLCRPIAAEMWIGRNGKENLNGTNKSIKCCDLHI